LKNGEDFRAVAKECSTLPPLGVITKGQLLPDLEKQLFLLNVGELSAPIESDKGIFLIKVLGKTEQETAALEEVKPRISAYLQNKKFKEELQRWIEKERQKAYIEIKAP